jgi:hypothetical protein
MILNNRNSGLMKSDQNYVLNEKDKIAMVAESKPNKWR